MMRVVFAEWRKLRRPTLFLGTLGAALFFTGLIVVDRLVEKFLTWRADLFMASLPLVGY